MSQIQVGDAAPNVALSTQGGEQLRLRDGFGHKTVVLFFYPKRFTYEIDSEGFVRRIFNWQFAAGRHLTEALEGIRGLSR